MDRQSGRCGAGWAMVVVVVLVVVVVMVCFGRFFFSLQEKEKGPIQGGPRGGGHDRRSTQFAATNI